MVIGYRMKQIKHQLSEIVGGNWTGTYSLRCQNGKFGESVTCNMLLNNYTYTPTTLQVVYDVIEKWRKEQLFGTIEIKFLRGTPGKPKETITYKFTKH